MCNVLPHIISLETKQQFKRLNLTYTDFSFRPSCELEVVVEVIGFQCPVNYTGSPQDSQTQVISKYAFLNSSHIYINPLSSQSTKPITLQT